MLVDVVVNVVHVVVKVVMDVVLRNGRGWRHGCRSTARRCRHAGGGRGTVERHVLIMRIDGNRSKRSRSRQRDERWWPTLLLLLHALYRLWLHQRIAAHHLWQ